MCTICGSILHRASKCPYRRAAWALAAVLLSGCTIAPDTLCGLPRPSAALNDTAGTIARQKAAAATWDSRCTVVGWVAR